MTSRSSPVELLSKKRARLRARGVKEVATEFKSKIVHDIRSEDALIFLTRDARWDGNVVRKSDEPLDLVRATARDGKDYERYIGTDSALTFARRLSSETNCWLVRARGMILHATWTTTGRAWTSEIRRFFVTPTAGAYIYESFTRSEARGLGLYPFALAGLGRALAADGIEKLFVGVEADNTPSLRAITKAGFEPAFEIAFRRRWGRVTIEGATGAHAELADEVLRA